MYGFLSIFCQFPVFQLACILEIEKSDVDLQVYV